MVLILIEKYRAWFAKIKEPMRIKRSNLLLTFHQHIPSPTSVTNIDVAVNENRMSQTIIIDLGTLAPIILYLVGSKSRTHCDLIFTFYVSLQSFLKINIMIVLFSHISEQNNLKIHSTIRPICPRFNL